MGSGNAMNTGGGMSVHTLRVPWKMSSALNARRAVVSELVALEVEAGLVEEAEIVISELVSNAVRHANALPDGMIQVSWTVTDGVVEVAVTDGGGPTAPSPAPPSTWSANGRGLRIVRGLAREWGVKEDEDGCTVWVLLGGPSPQGFP